MNEKIRTIKIPEDLCNYIESLMYETNSRKDVIAFMLRQGTAEGEAFDRYHRQYLEFYAKYETAKEELVAKYIAPAAPNCNWNLNFRTQEVEIRG